MENRNKIEGKDKSITELLNEKKFTIGYFQREYRWEAKHIQQLIEDLITAFRSSYDEKDETAKIKTYSTYYLGPIVLNEEEAKLSIIDGQQRITSLTLLLIYLKHKLKEHNCDRPKINELIFSDHFGENDFNISNSDRAKCLDSLFKEGKYSPPETANETEINIVDRYGDIKDYFEITEKQELISFVYWLINNVIIIEITTYSTKNAAMIFETMNDRGLNLTPAEMLKGFILSQIKDNEKRTECDNLWKKQILKLHKIDNNDNAFFQAWFRGKYAETIREGKKDSENRDFELISQFHRWVRDNYERKIKLISSDDFYNFLTKDFKFFSDWYIRIKDKYDEKMPFVYYIRHFGLGESIQDALLLSVINKKDGDDIIKKKLNNTAKFIETFVIRRSINHTRYGVSGIRSTFFNYIKQIRNKKLIELNNQLQKEYNDRNINVKWENLDEFELNNQNKRFTKHFFARITSYIESLSGKDRGYKNYHHPEEIPFEIEHIIADNKENKEEFKEDFNLWRNKLGALALLPRGNNQSYKNYSYKDKVKHYIRENYMLSTLNEEHYKNNPNFIRNDKIKDLKFEAHKEFKKEDIEKRNKLLIRICQQIWANEYDA